MNHTPLIKVLQTVRTFCDKENLPKKKKLVSYDELANSNSSQTRVLISSNKF